MPSETQPDILVNENEGWKDVTGIFSDGDTVTVSNNDAVSLLRIATSAAQPPAQALGHPIKPLETSYITIAGKLWAKTERGVTPVCISGVS